ncbi:TetR/AcrR family transcriptional regulator [Celerinatantimonas yamalensis]|uniref:TetR/AcrR family transcriptional regulator n=1 Tax=Celerinatantimonas yamalensis TaxID=559956 RepID=A0ABW9G593_9GAMM
MRTAEFDRQQVLEAAMDVFCQKGYANTTMQDLKLATGLHPGSLYCAFKNKRGVLLAALTQFIESRWQQSQVCFESGDPLEGIHQYLRQLVAKLCLSQSHCLLSRTVADFSAVDEDIRETLSEPWQQLLVRIEQQLQLAQTQGLLRQGVMPAEAAWVLLVNIFGLRSLPSFMADEKSLYACVDLQIQLIREPQ